jgi:hypothetical protein
VLTIPIYDWAKFVSMPDLLPAIGQRDEAGGEGTMSTFNDRRRARTNVAIDILPPEDGKAKVIHFRRPREIVDAHFVPVGAGVGRRQTARSDKSAGASAPQASARSNRFAAGFAEAIERRLLRLAPDSFLALVAAVFAVVFAFSGGFSLIADHGPASEAGPALDITHVTMTPQDANGMRVLLINGIVENRTSERHEMPSIRAELMSGETILASTLISTSVSQIGGAESYGFSARVPHPGGKLPDLRLSLAKRGA